MPWAVCFLFLVSFFCEKQFAARRSFLRDSVIGDIVYRICRSGNAGNGIGRQWRCFIPGAVKIVELPGMNAGKIEIETG